MSQNSGISWCTHSFNPIWGCSAVSEGCRLCYAATFSHRLGHDLWGYDKEGRKPVREFGNAHWNAPLKWNRDAQKAGVRARVFCASMADAFDEFWPDGTRERLWALIRATPHLDWLLLTKRPANIPGMLPPDWGPGYENVWLGVTTEHQAAADERIPQLLAVPAKLRFLSVEPLLGPVDLSGLLRGGVQWVIVGGESGAGARLMQRGWAYLALDTAHQEGATTWFKQTGAALAKQMHLKASKGDDSAEWPQEWRDAQTLPTMDD